ncbi:hypothetical protein PhCBS80983_g05464 [Powellomyces hirtus]|uniref:Uncharacterized protein n=1 Tax=Powellomyces hirtus TaxID=109895 RepID=A0A507DU62_9FUNG|nr:hypothetical protein PhCBS80983_g05464 [Powellomyces hirtus]
MTQWMWPSAPHLRKKPFPRWKSSPSLEEIEPAIEKAVPAMEEAVPVPAIEEAIPVPAIEEAIPVPAIEEAIPAEIPAPQVMKLLEVADLPRKTVAQALTSVRSPVTIEEDDNWDDISPNSNPSSHASTACDFDDLVSLESFDGDNSEQAPDLASPESPDRSVTASPDVFMRSMRSEYWPFSTKEHFFSALLSSGTRQRLSVRVRKWIWWWAHSLGLRLPSLKSIQKEMHAAHNVAGCHTYEENSVSGRPFFQNSVLDTIRREISNPVVVGLLETYPEETTRPSELWHNVKWHEEPILQAPMVSVNGLDFYTGETAMTSDRTLIRIMKFFKVKGKLSFSGTILTELPALPETPVGQLFALARHPLSSVTRPVEDLLPSASITMVVEQEADGAILNIQASTATGVKCVLAQKVIDKMGAQNGDFPANFIREGLPSLVQRRNPLLQLPGFDGHLDTLVEVLHTVLLGFVKYVGNQTIKYGLVTGVNQATNKATVLARIDSFDANGTDRGPMRGSTFVTYVGSFIGRDFKAFIQAGVFIFHGLIADDVMAMWEKLAVLSVLVYENRISNLDAYCDPTIRALFGIQPKASTFVLHEGMFVLLQDRRLARIAVQTKAELEVDLLRLVPDVVFHGLPIAEETPHRRLVSHADVKAILNFQHHCGAAGCAIAVTGRKRLERRETTIMRRSILHGPLQQFVVNLHCIKTAQALRTMVPKLDWEENAARLKETLSQTWSSAKWTQAPTLPRQPHALMDGASSTNEEDKGAESSTLMP